MHRPNRRTSLTGIGALTAAWLLAPASAWACQYCVMTMSYNGLRFAVPWCYLTGAWLIVAVIADLRALGKSDTSFSWRESNSRPVLILLLASLVLSIMGLTLVVFALFPFLLLPYLWPKQWAWNSHARERVQRAPIWLRRTAGVFLLVALLGGILAYFYFPPMQHEPGMLMIKRQTRENVRELADLLDLHYTKKGNYPEADIIRWEDGLYSVLAPETLPPKPLGVVEDWLTDPFAYRAVQPGSGGLSVSHPLGMAIVSHGHFIRRDSTRFPMYQYFSYENGFVFWGRGADTVLEPAAGEFLRTNDIGNWPVEGPLDSRERGTPIPPALCRLAYDPTNGLFSPGDAFFVRRR